ncbi:MAG: DUF6036 family nucleotidyltransferase [Verrucomicrobiia bacterium]
MRLQSLIHLARLVGEMVSSKSIGVFGSASLLATHPTLGDGGMPLERTFDADLLVQPSDELTARMLREAIGEGSAFSEKNGYHADILRPEILDTLPQGWEKRLVPLPSVPTAKCLHPLDLALVKLVLGREKDLSLLHALLKLKLLDAESLLRHYHATPLGEREAFAVGRNLQKLLPKA